MTSHQFIDSLKIPSYSVRTGERMAVLKQFVFLFALFFWSFDSWSSMTTHSHGAPLASKFAFLQTFESIEASQGRPWKTGPSGAPGLPHLWAPALKQAVGTAYESDSHFSPLWFTVAEGILTEVFYPSVDQAQMGDLQLLITDGKKFFAEQKTDVLSQVRFSSDGASVQISGEEKRGAFRIEQEIVTDSRLPVLRLRTVFRPQRPGLKMFVLFKPALKNSGNRNMAYAQANALVATHENRAENPVFSALVSSIPWLTTATGYVGFSDGWQDLSKHFQLTENWPQAGPGNVALTGELLVPLQGDFTFELALSFSDSLERAVSEANLSLQTPFQHVRDQYNLGWSNYIEELENSEPGKKHFFKQSEFARRSAVIIKMHEDKMRRGALVASLSKPAIPDGVRAEEGGGGYHLVWPRDLYHAAMGLLAAGDFRTPVEVLHYLVETQTKDGSWPQNYWVNGTPYWSGLQLDEVAFPVLLAYHLSQKGVHPHCLRDLEMVKKAAFFISTHGPSTPQDRWEEIGGYVPSTLAAEISALKAAAHLTGLARFSDVARSWSESLESWTVVPDGPLGKNYYLRASPFGKPSQMEWVELANGAGGGFAFEILDGGFLELVRYKVREFQDPAILSTLQIYDAPERLYRRYNRDAYGPNRVGGFWPLLVGERGHYEVMRGDVVRARQQLFIMENLALESGLLPEQVQTSSPLKVGLGVASPLIWAHAEEVLLQRSIEEGRVFDAP